MNGANPNNLITKERLQVLVDSRARTSGSETNFTLTLNKSLTRARILEVISAEVPFVYYVVNNNTATFIFQDHTAVDRTVTLPAGQYTSATVASTLQTLIRVYMGTATVVYSSNRYTIAYSSTFKIYTTGTISRQLGFTKNTESALSHTSESFANNKSDVYRFSTNILTIKKSSASSYIDKYITPGNYTAATLATEVQTRLNQAPITASYSGGAYVFTINNSSVSGQKIGIPTGLGVGSLNTQLGLQGPVTAASVITGSAISIASYTSTGNSGAENDRFVFRLYEADDTYTEYTATVAAGTYVGNAAVFAAVQTAIDTIIGHMTGYTVTYSSSTYKYTIANASTFTMFISGNGASTIDKIMGYTSDKTATTSAVSDIVANVSGPNYLLLKSRTLSQKKENKAYVDENYIDVIAKILIERGPGYVNIYTPKHSNPIYYPNPITFSELDFSLEDPDGALVNLNGQTMSLTLSIDTV